MKSIKNLECFKISEPIHFKKIKKEKTKINLTLFIDTWLEAKLFLQIWHHYSPALRGPVLALAHSSVSSKLSSTQLQLSRTHVLKKTKNLKPHLASQLTACVIYRSNRLDWPSCKWERYITAGHTSWSESLCQASTGFWNTTYDFQQCFYLFSPNSRREVTCPLILLLCTGGTPLLPCSNLKCHLSSRAISRAYLPIHSSLDFLILQHNL